MSTEISKVSCAVLHKIVSKRNTELIDVHEAQMVKEPIHNEEGRVIGFRYAQTQPEHVKALAREISELDFILEELDVCLDE